LLERRLMHPGDPRDIEPGISAVLAVEAGQAGLESLVLDLAAVLNGLVADNFEILVIEFGGSERTSGLLSDLAARRPALPLRVLPGTYANQVCALAAGFDASIYDLLFVTATDGQYEQSELNHLLEAIEHGADVAVGYRLERSDGLGRRLESWAWNAAVGLVFGKVGRDVECCFKLFRRTLWQRMPRPVSAVTFNVELLVCARRNGFLVGEVAVSHHWPQGGTGQARQRAGVGQALLELNALRRSLGKAEPQPLGVVANQAHRHAA
jgi:hypothetical protein